jgi:hypothetical protein
MNNQEFLSKILIALPFVIGAVIFFILGMRRIQLFFLADYQGNFKKRLIDDLFANFLFALGTACIMPIFNSIESGKINWDLFWFILCLAILIIPFSVIGSYWQSYSSNKLWGGFTPFVRAKMGFSQSQPESLKTLKVNLSKIKVPRRVTFQAAAIGLLAILLLNLGLYLIRWNDSNLIGLLFRIAASAALGVGISMTILSKDLSRRIERIRDGEKLDYGDSDL